MTNVQRREAREALAREGLEKYRESEDEGRAWMRAQYYAVLRAPKRNGDKQTRCGAVQAVLQGKNSLKTLMLQLDDAPGSDETRPYYNASLFTLDRKEYDRFKKEKARAQAGLQRRGRMRIQCATFVKRITAMGRTLLERSKTRENGLAMLIPLAFSLSARANEVDPCASDRVDGHRNSPLDFDIDLEAGTAVQKNVSKPKPGLQRKHVQIVCLLDAQLTQDMLEFVHDCDMPTAASFSASHWMSQPPSQKGSKQDGRPRGFGLPCRFVHCGGKCDGASNFVHIMRDFNLKECIEEIAPNQMHFNAIRSISLTLFPSIHDVRECAAGYPKAVEWATAMQAGHVDDSKIWDDYVNNQVQDDATDDMPPKKRVRLLVDESTERPIGLETF